MWTVHGSPDPINSRNQPNVAGLKDSVHLEKKTPGKRNFIEQEGDTGAKEKEVPRKRGREADDTDLKEHMSILLNT